MELVVYIMEILTVIYVIFIIIFDNKNTNDYGN